MCDITNIIYNILWKNPYRLPFVRLGSLISLEGGRMVRLLLLTVVTSVTIMLLNVMIICAKNFKGPVNQIFRYNIDSNLRFLLHINNIVMRPCSSINKFYKLNNILPVNIMRNIYLFMNQCFNMDV